MDALHGREAISWKERTQTMPTKYFISYTNATENDIAWAKWVDWVLRNKLGAETIMQAYDFHPGENFKERMHDALKTSDVVVCVLTHAYMKSVNCTDEWTNADRFIPVRFDDCKPEGLLKCRIYIDLNEMDQDSARHRLIEQLKGESRPTHEPDAPFSGHADVADEPDFPASSHSGSRSTVQATVTGNGNVVIAEKIVTVNM
jgi:hypothetical protein